MSKALVKTVVGGAVLACWLGSVEAAAEEVVVEAGRRGGESQGNCGWAREGERAWRLRQGPDSSSLQALCPQTAPGITETSGIG